VEDGFKIENFLTAEDWQQLAEYTAIYEKMTSLAIALQADMAGSLSIAKLQLTDCLVELAGTPTSEGVGYSPYKLNDRQVVFDVVIVNDSDHTWTPQRAFKDLPRRKMCLPLELPEPGHPDIEDNRVWNVDGVDKKLPVMSQNSRLLVVRFGKEACDYFHKTTDDERVNMFLNPFVNEFGIMHLCEMKFFGTDFAETCEQKTLQDLFTMFGPDITEINNRVEKEHNEEIEKEKEAQNPTTSSSASVVHGPPSPLRQTSVTNSSWAYRKMRRKLAMAAPRTAVPNMSLADKQKQQVTEEMANFKAEATEQIKEYKAYLKSLTTGDDDEPSSNVKWMTLITRFPTALAEEEMKTHGKLVMKMWDENDCPFATAYATKRFDLIRFWLHEKHGGRWKLLQALAMAHLGQPFTNAAIERCFSKTTWVDAARTQRVLDCTFEMRVLDAANREFVETAKPLLDAKHVFQESSAAIDDAVKRFAVPLYDEKKHGGTANTAVLSEEVVVVDEDEETSVIAGTNSSEDTNDGDEGDDDDEANVVAADSILCQIDDKEFVDEMEGLLKMKSKDTTKQPPPSSTKKNPPSTSSKKRKSSADN
jgi:hypothetical protein